MAQKRVQVAQLNAPTQDNLVGGTAPIVETMQTLAPDQTPVNPLSQFISAIAPAMEADAADRRVQRLKKQQEIENGIRAKKENQLEQQRANLLGDIGIEYKKNETANLEMGEAAYLQKRQASYAPYVQQLRDGPLGKSDPDLIDALEGDLQLADVTFMKTKFNPAATDLHYTQLANGLNDTILKINAQVAAGLLSNADGIKQIETQKDSFLEANKEYFDHKKITASLVDLAKSDTNDPSRVNSPLVQVLSGKGTNKINSLNTAEHREIGAAINKRQAAAAKENLTQAKKAATGIHLDAVAGQVLNGNFTNINTDTKTNAKVNVNGTDVIIDKKLTNADYQASIEKIASQQMAEVDALPDGTVEEINTKDTHRVALQRRTYEAYEAIDSKPPEVALALRYANTVWQSEMTPDNLVLAKAAYEQLEKVEAYLGPEKIASMFGSDKKSLTMYRTLKSSLKANETFSQAMDVARRYDPDSTPKINVTYEEIQNTIDPTGPSGWFTFTNMDEMVNGVEMVQSVSERARVIKGTNPTISEEDAKTQAINEIAGDWRAMTMPDGSIVGVRAESGAYVERNTKATEQVLKDAMDDPAFVNAVSEEFLFPSKLVPTSTFGVEGVKQVSGFSLMARNDPYNSNILQIYATGTDSSGKMSPTEPSHSLGFIDLTKVAKQQKFKFIEDTMGRHALTVAPLTTSVPEQELMDDPDLVADYTPTVTKSFAEMNVSDIKNTDTFKSLERAFSSENDILKYAETNMPQRLAIPQAALAEGLKDLVDVGKKLVNTLNPISTGNATATLINDEGFSSTVYIDTEGHKTTGHGLKLVDIEPDERALIKDINNVTKDESKAVVELKVKKISNYFSDAVKGFENLPDTAQSGIIQMGYQLGRFNVTKKWPKFMESIKEATQYAEGSVEQGKALAKAKFNMLYNVAEDGKVTATKWATQTANRAMKVANTVGSTAGEAATAVFEAVIPKAHADTDVIPEAEQLRVGEQPTASAVADIAMAMNPADAAYKYYGMDENTDEGAKGVKGFFETSVGNWNPDNESVEKFATNKAWCAAFLTQVLRDSGIDTKALFGKDKFDQIRAKAYTTVGTQVDTTQAKAGDIMIKEHTKEERKKHKLGFGHVGIVVKVEGDEVFFIGGNTGDKVTMSSYNMKEKKVAIRRLNNASDIPTETLPSMLELKAGVYTDKLVKKTKNLFTSMYENIFE